MNIEDFIQMRDIIRTEFEVRDQKLDEKLLKWKSEIIDSVDTMSKEISDNREFREISSYQTTGNTRRIEKLEKKVFGFVGSGI